MNLANMPIQIVNALKKQGYTAEHVQYTLGQGHKFGYALDREINLRELGGRVKAHAHTLKDYLDRDFDIFHFWNKSLFYKLDYTHMTGFDIPLIKARNKRVLFRFSGFDVRLPSKDIEVNPYSPFRYGYQHKVDETAQQKFLDFAHEYVDQFLVQDPELQQFCPEARIIPRALDLDEWQFVGIRNNPRPLVVHAPSNNAVKGTDFVLKAVEKLQIEQKLPFEFKLIKGMKHEEARKWYEKADIVVDQLMIGATGVLSLEAMALGKPVILYLREDLFKPFYGSELPCANANPDTIIDVLRELISDYEWRQHLSVLGRKTVEKHHDVNQVIKSFTSLYEEVMTKPVKTPTGTRDIDYLEFQTEITQKYEILSRNSRKQFLELRKVAAKPPQGDTYADHLDAGKKMGTDFRLAVLSLYLPKFLFKWIQKLMTKQSQKHR